ncbi:5-amino-6-(5-phosphoribosylamino)uracil reductase [Pseudomonas prosekii]|uniref:dihydrofolate reductase family protein n=1 Tax=Pseudomonas prosekii TaxID=1148509 RepID=UPI000D60F231|nr:dihydrofolate reductase family protein [Pseudomonas prosekii]PWE38084.1 5-amino-6-(5-phosphoribosylamino)uracil reductase [Pseudomonas prosekii]
MRPKIICHMVSSIDGRLLVERWTPPAKGIDSEIVGRIYEEVAGRLDADGWIVGRKSMAPMTKGQPKEITVSSKVERSTFHGTRGERSIAVAIDPNGKLHYGRDNVGEEHAVAVLGHHVSDEYLAELQADGVSYLFAGSDGLDLSAAMETLGDEFGVKTILLEGGGVTNGAFLKAGLIDEISVLIYPGIDGLAGVSSIFEYLGNGGDKPAAGRALRHQSTDTLEGGIVWIRYVFEEAPSA